MTFHGRLIYFGAITAVVAGVTTARADSIKVTASYVGDQPTQVTSITSDYLVHGYGSWFYVGASNFEDVAVTSGGPYSTPGLSVGDVQLQLGTSFQGFCIDLGHIISPGTYAWDVATLGSVTSSVNGLGISPDQVTAIKYLWGTHGESPFPDTAQGAIDAATFQMAIWTLLYSPAYSTATNPTNFSNVNSATAASWASNAYNHIGTYEDVYALISDPVANQQSFSIALVGPSHNDVTPVPLPMSAEMGFGMLAGSGVLFAYRKHRRRGSRIA